MQAQIFLHAKVICRVMHRILYVIHARAVTFVFIADCYCVEMFVDSYTFGSCDLLASIAIVLQHTNDRRRFEHRSDNFVANFCKD